jgi:hypothetical protein
VKTVSTTRVSFPRQLPPTSLVRGPPGLLGPWVQENQPPTRCRIRTPASAGARARCQKGWRGRSRAKAVLLLGGEEQVAARYLRHARFEPKAGRLAAGARDNPDTLAQVTVSGHPACSGLHARGLADEKMRRCASCS